MLFTSLGGAQARKAISLTNGLINDGEKDGEKKEKEGEKKEKGGEKKEQEGEKKEKEGDKKEKGDGKIEKKDDDKKIKISDKTKAKIFSKEESEEIRRMVNKKFRTFHP